MSSSNVNLTFNHDINDQSIVVKVKIVILVLIDFKCKFIYSQTFYDIKSPVLKHDSLN